MPAAPRIPTLNKYTRNKENSRGITCGSRSWCRCQRRPPMSPPAAAGPRRPAAERAAPGGGGGGRGGRGGEGARAAADAGGAAPLAQVMGISAPAPPDRAPQGLPVWQPPPSERRGRPKTALASPNTTSARGGHQPPEV